MDRLRITSTKQGSVEQFTVILQDANARFMEDTANVATSATDLIIPIGILLWALIHPLTLFFIFLWRGAGRISYASILALVLSVISFVLGTTPQPILWLYDNQTSTFTSQYMVPQTNPTVDIYYGLYVYQVFLIIVACMKMILESGIFGREEVG